MNEPWHTCESAMTHNDEHGSFICMTWLIHVIHMNDEYVGHDSFFCGTWLIHMYDMTHSCHTYEWRIRGTWLILLWDMTHSYVWHDSLMSHMNDEHTWSITTWASWYVVLSIDVIFPFLWRFSASQIVLRMGCDIYINQFQTHKWKNKISSVNGCYLFVESWMYVFIHTWTTFINKCIYVWIYI